MSGIKTTTMISASTERSESVLHSCAVSPNSRMIASASADKTLRLWDASTGECLHILKHENEVVACAFSPDGRQIFTVTSGIDRKQLSLWDVSTGVKGNM